LGTGADSFKRVLGRWPRWNLTSSTNGPINEPQSILNELPFHVW